MEQRESRLQRGGEQGTSFDPPSPFSRSEAYDRRRLACSIKEKVNELESELRTVKGTMEESKRILSDYEAEIAEEERQLGPMGRNREGACSSSAFTLEPQHEHHNQNNADAAVAMQDVLQTLASTLATMKRKQEAFDIKLHQLQDKVKEGGDYPSRKEEEEEKAWTGPTAQCCNLQMNRKISNIDVKFSKIAKHIQALESKLQEKNACIRGLEVELREERANKDHRKERNRSAEQGVHIGIEKVQELLRLARAEKTEKLEIANRAMTLCKVLRNVLQECRESYLQQTPEASFEAIQAKNLKMLTTIDDAMKSLSSMSVISNTTSSSSSTGSKMMLSPTTPLMKSIHDLMSITDSPSSKDNRTLQPVRQIRSLRKNASGESTLFNARFSQRMNVRALDSEAEQAPREQGQRERRRKTNTRRALWPEVVGGVKPLRKRRFSNIGGTIMKLLFFSTIFLLGKRNYAIKQLQTLKQ